MTDALREELNRIGEAAPRAAVPGDVWARGRRARRRDRVVVGGALLSVLLVLGGLGWVLGAPSRDEASPVSPRGAAVPSVIYPVPQRLASGLDGPDPAWNEKVAETDLQVGQASVAFASSEYQSLPVIVTAADGAYHLIRLPGWVGASLAGYQTSTPPLALSPDGRQLAWGWYDPSSFGRDTVSAGVRIADLESGRVRSILLSGGRGVAVASLGWSPESRWLVWQGMQMKKWTERSTGWQRNVAGRIGPGAMTSEPIPISRGGDEQLAIDNAGTVGWTTDDGGWWTFARGGSGGGVFDILRGRTGESLRARAFNGKGDVVLSAGQPTRYASFFPLDDDGGPSGAVVRELVTRPLPGDRYPEGATIEPLGWIDNDHAVELVTPVHDLEPDTGWTSGDSELAVMSLRDGDQPAYDVVARVKQGGEGAGRIQGLTVAVDLMSLDQPTREFPAPEWPWSDERKVAVYGGTAVALVVAVGLGVAYLRRRR